MDRRKKRERERKKERRKKERRKERKRERGREGEREESEKIERRGNDATGADKGEEGSEVECTIVSITLNVQYTLSNGVAEILSKRIIMCSKYMLCTGHMHQE